MFERFTTAARDVVIEALDTAAELGSTTMTPGHLLYGCAVSGDVAGQRMRDSGMTAAGVRGALTQAQGPTSARVDDEALAAIGIDADAVRTAVEETFGAGALDTAPDRRARTGRARRPRVSPQGKRAMQQAMVVVRELHHDRIEPGHLLLGVLRVDDPVVAQVLARSGTSVAALSASVLAGLAAA